LFGVLKTVEKKIVTYYVRRTVRIVNRGHKAPNLRNVTEDKLGLPPETQAGRHNFFFLS